MTTTIGGTTGITFPDATTQNTSPYTGGLAFRNRIINGHPMIDQRNAGASVTPTDGQFTVDRWRVKVTQASKFTAQQNAGAVTPPAGFKNYLGFTSSSAYSLLSSDKFLVCQPIEGLNFYDLAWGTVNAKSVTVSFWAYSSLTGTFAGALGNENGDRSYPFTYTISSANTWTYCTVTAAGDTTGTWATGTGVGAYVYFNLGAGSTYASTAGTWQTGIYTTVTGSVNLVANNAATLYITGVQLEKGSTATSFDYRPYGTELALCQRYYEKSYNVETTPGTATRVGTPLIISYNTGSNRPVWNISFSVSKRTTATIVLYSPNSGTSGKVGGPSGADYNGSTLDLGAHGFNAYQSQTTAISDGDYYLHWTATAEL